MTANGFTYAEVGASARSGTVPGYWTVDRSARLGRGREVFDLARHRIRTWEMHRRAGIDVHSAAPTVDIDQDVILWFRWGPVRVGAPCRVVYVIDEPNRVGFAYGTLAGHPERGEEAFAVAIDADGLVTARIWGFSRPASVLGRLDAAAGHLVQRRILRRYLAGLVEVETR